MFLGSEWSVLTPFGGTGSCSCFGSGLIRGSGTYGAPGLLEEMCDHGHLPGVMRSVTGVCPDVVNECPGFPGRLSDVATPELSAETKEEKLG